jgi:hypothetical protein
MSRKILISFDEDTFYGIEAIAEMQEKSFTSLIVEIAKVKCDDYKKENNLTKIPVTKLRKAKIAQGKNGKNNKR